MEHLVNKGSRRGVSDDREVPMGEAGSHRVQRGLIIRKDLLPRKSWNNPQSGRRPRKKKLPAQEVLFKRSLGFKPVS